MSGVDPKNQSKELGLPNWVVSRGGEYFFSPSISALRDVFSRSDGAAERSSMSLSVIGIELSNGTFL